MITSFLRAEGELPGRIYGSRGSAGALLIALMAPSAGPLSLVLAPDEAAAERFASDIEFFQRLVPGIRAMPVHRFPGWEVPPFHVLSPQRRAVQERIRTLRALMKTGRGIVVSSVASALQKVPPRDELAGLCLALKPGMEIDRGDLVGLLVACGYIRTSLVEEVGEYAVRGSLVDLFSPDGSLPVRMEFFGDRIETIRAFDGATQKSTATESLTAFDILPVREVLAYGERLTLASRRIKARADACNIPKKDREELIGRLASGFTFGGIDPLLPFVYHRLETLFDYFPEAGSLFLVGAASLSERAGAFWNEACEANTRALEEGRIVPETGELYIEADELARRLEPFRSVRFDRLRMEAPGEEKPSGSIDLVVETNEAIRAECLRRVGTDDVLAPLTRRIGAWIEKGIRVCLVCRRPVGSRRMMELLVDYGIDPSIEDGIDPAAGPGVCVVEGALTGGFVSRDLGLALVTEEEIFGRKVHRDRRPTATAAEIRSTLQDLEPGNCVVHVDFGIGRYRGLERLAVGEAANDYIHLEYAGGDKLYLPVDRLGLVQKYIGGGSGGLPGLDKLGGKAWETRKKRAKASAMEIAGELVEVYAARKVHERASLPEPDHIFREFESAFEYDETPDQIRSIDEIMADLQSPRPMDRLVCGDVGYGKTEVAIRAAFSMVMNGRQVAILVPTTVLAQQHMTTFSKRLAPYPVEVEMLSRFRTRREQQEIIGRCRRGDVDIVIGTHRLLQKDVDFSNLGLLIIDEEQRFGVTHKERIKKMRKLVDVLTLSATPIPRTLYMSMVGIRDLSVIKTPPEERRSIRTYVTCFDKSVIREAVLREIGRDGQVFFVHNRVEDIYTMGSYLERLVPEARIAVAHGQMSEKQLEQVMLQFVDKEVNLLVCTTIIESGLDIPEANTIIINRAERLGLAQLYQLRGRVGRSRQQAYAYILVPQEAGVMTEEAEKRLRVIQEMSDLGAGFRIANYDLEIRGAGNLLGASQSGQIAAVGLELYTQLMEKAVRELKGEHVAEEIDPEIQIRVPAYIPEDYVEDPNQRLALYKRLSLVTSEGALGELSEEIRDRFGPIPPIVKDLFEVIAIRVRMKRVMIESLRWDGQRVIFEFHPKTTVPPEAIVSLVQTDSRRFQFLSNYSFTMAEKGRNTGKLLHGIREVLAFCEEQMEG